MSSAEVINFFTQMECCESPGVPTVNNKGIKGYELIARFGWVSPAGLLADSTCRLNREIARIIARPDVRDTMSAQGIYAAPPAPPAAFGKSIAEGLAKRAPLV